MENAGSLSRSISAAGMYAALTGSSRRSCFPSHALHGAPIRSGRRRLRIDIYPQSVVARDRRLNCFDKPPPGCAWEHAAGAGRRMIGHCSARRRQEILRAGRLGNR